LTHQTKQAMTSNFKYQDGTETFTIKTGEIFTVEQDCNGFWGYTSNNGYNLWEVGNLPTTKAQAIKMLRELEKIEVLNAKYN